MGAPPPPPRGRLGLGSTWQAGASEQLLPRVPRDKFTAHKYASPISACTSPSELREHRQQEPLVLQHSLSPRRLRSAARLNPRGRLSVPIGWATPALHRSMPIRGASYPLAWLRARAELAARASARRCRSGPPRILGTRPAPAAGEEGRAFKRRGQRHASSGAFRLPGTLAASLGCSWDPD